MSSTPRVILYHQTIHDKLGNYVSLLPLVTENSGLTHLIIGAFHLNDEPGDVTLNDDKVTHFKLLWEEMDTLQYAGVKVMAMLGGAAKGTYARLDTRDTLTFESFYLPLKTILLDYKFDGIDLDVEEEMSLDGIKRLIDRIYHDFGPAFIITLAPCASAMHGGPHLSGFHYGMLETVSGSKIHWYNTQYYCGWAMLDCAAQYNLSIDTGFFAPNKVVMGFVTHPENGSGFVSHIELKRTLEAVMACHSTFGGVSGWEYFNSLCEGNERRESWMWARMVNDILSCQAPLRHSR